MTTKRFIVATAGHVDHGKSALVKALTGTDPDRLPEEKSRGITIDLGFAHLDLKGPGGGEGITYRLGIVDVPGHEDFVKNMVAGVGSIDLALFVVAADDGWMPQTEEHLQILSYLGVGRGVVALTKIDLLAGNSEGLERVVRERLEGSPFAEVPIVSTSASVGTGMAELKEVLVKQLTEVPLPPDIGKPRLPVDRVFTLRGIGTVVTGTLTGGRLRRGQAALLQPGGKATRLRSLQTHKAEVEESGPGTRTAVNLADLGVAGKGKGGGGGEVGRGEILTVAELGEASPTVDVLVVKSARLRDASGGAARALKDGMRIRFHWGSGNWPARLYFLDEKEVGPGEEGVAELRLDEPVFVLDGDRFVLRDWSEEYTLGGGVVLDAVANRRSFRGKAQRRFLARRAHREPDPVSYVSAVLEREGILKESELLRRSVFGADEVGGVVTKLAGDQKSVRLDKWVADMAWWTSLWNDAIAMIDSEHRAHPERPGLTLNALRGGFKGRIPEGAVFDVLVASLVQNGFVQAGTFVRRAGHRPALPPELEAAGARLRSLLSENPFGPPSKKELAPDGTSQQALRFLRETGEATELGAEVVVLTESFVRMRALVVAFIRGNGSATVSELRQQLGTTRRIMMPLLDRLDRDGATLREGDKRVLGRNAGSD